MRLSVPTSVRAFVAAISLLAASSFAHAAEKLVYINDWLPGGDKALPFYAVQKGLFAKEGLDVTVQSARGSSEAITRIATGAADVGSGALAALLSAKAQNEVPVTSVMSVFPMQPDSLFTVGGSSIRTLKDVEGKRVATATFTASNVIWPLILKANGVEESKVTLLKVDPAALVPMLATGQADATINWSTASPAFVKALAEVGKKLKIIPWADYGYEGYGYSVFASDKAIAQRPETIRKFVKVMREAAAMAPADPAGVVAAMKAAFPEIDPVLIEAQFQTIVPLIDNPISKAEGLGTFDKARLAKTWEWTAKAQNIPLDKLDPEKAVSRAFLN
jgi:NitT/TauT family transport system substrate-binding protein